MDTFPKKAFIQSIDGQLTNEFQSVANELEKRGIPYAMVEQEFLSKEIITINDIVIGDFTFSNIALDKLKIPKPEPFDYPQCLSYLLQRKVWKTTLQQASQWVKEN